MELCQVSGIIFELRITIQAFVLTCIADFMLKVKAFLCLKMAL